MAPNLAPVGGNNSNLATRSGGRAGGDLREPSNSNGASGGSSGSSSASSGSGSSSASGGSSNAKNCFIQKYLIDCKSIYSCIYCRTHLANHDELVSRSFQGNHGRAYLFNSVVNVTCGPAVQRELNTGSHAVADIFCENCETTLGWKYEKAYVEAQKYKEGKYIIELAHVVRENKHLELDKKQMFFDRTTSKSITRLSNQQEIKNLNNSLSLPSPSSQWYSQSISNNVTNNNNNNNNNNNINTSNNNNNNNNNNRNSCSSEYDFYNTCYSQSRNEMQQEQDPDDDLMFVFYDDLSSSISSYPNSLSSSHHNKYRRSLYLDSTPYDWKYYTTATSSSAAEGDGRKKIDNSDSNLIDNKTDNNNKNNSIKATTKNSANNQAPLLLPGSIELSVMAYSSSSSPSSSSSSSSPCSTTNQISNDSFVSAPYQEGKSRNNNNNNTNSDVIRDHNAIVDQLDSERNEDDETQFKFEGDNRQDLASNSNDNSCEPKSGLSNFGRRTQQQQQVMKFCENQKKFDSGNDDDEKSCIEASTSSSFSPDDKLNNNDENNLNFRSNLYDKRKGNKSSLDSCTNTNGNNDKHFSPLASTGISEHNNSISLDDDEFYDCFTDHDVTNTTSC